MMIKVYKFLQHLVVNGFTHWTSKIGNAIDIIKFKVELQIKW
jgi:hypothetical protein